MSKWQYVLWSWDFSLYVLWSLAVEFWRTSSLPSKLGTYTCYVSTFSEVVSICKKNSCLFPKALVDFCTQIDFSMPHIRWSLCANPTVIASIKICLIGSHQSMLVYILWFLRLRKETQVIAAALNACNSSSWHLCSTSRCYFSYTLYFSN